MMNTQQLTSLAFEALDDLKGQDIKTMDVTEHCDFTDTMLFCTGTSNRHVKSLAKNVIEEVKKQGNPPLGVEGLDEGEWVLVDLGDVVVHIMQQDMRDHYNVEQLWEYNPRMPQSDADHH